ncbi:hypothetical protein CL628_04370 [bacterium]|nr:hypothetical protein [bacterium]
MDYDHILKGMTLAPSAHNSQPWRFATGDNAIDVYTDESRHLPASDPDRRELYISLGCAVANGVVAGAQMGQGARIEYFPEGKDHNKPAARVHFESATEVKHYRELGDAVTTRRTNRSLYHSHNLTHEDRASLPTLADDAVKLIEDRGQIEAIAKLTGEGSFETLKKQAFKDELSHWVRNNWTKQPDGMPGYAMGMPAPMSLIAPLLVRIAPIHKQEQTQTGKQVRSASAIAVVSTPYDTPRDWLHAGLLCEYLWLEATAAGLAAAPLAAAIEAGSDLREELKIAAGITDFPQVVMRLGHSSKKNLKATPRRSVTDCLVQ